MDVKTDDIKEDSDEDGSKMIFNQWEPHIDGIMRLENCNSFKEWHCHGGIMEHSGMLSRAKRGQYKVPPEDFGQAPHVTKLNDLYADLSKYDSIINIGGKGLRETWAQSEPTIYNDFNAAQTLYKQKSAEGGRQKPLRTDVKFKVGKTGIPVNLSNSLQ